MEHIGGQIERIERNMKLIDQRIPFEVIAVDNATYTQLISDWEEETHMMEVKRRSGSPKSLAKARVVSKRE